MARETLFIDIRTGRERRKRLAIDAAIVVAFIAAIYALATLYAIAAIAPAVYHVAEIETVDGRTYRAAMASESACIAFTRAIGASVASANCYSETK